MMEDFKLWLTIMDGGCYNDETSKKAYLVVKSMYVEEIITGRILDSTTVCEFFTKEEAMGVCSSSLGVYLRYYSSFLFTSMTKTDSISHMNSTKSWISKLQGNYFIHVINDRTCAHLELTNVNK